MPRYPLGQSIRQKTTVFDASGALITPATCTLTVQKPDATQIVYSTPTVDSTGQFHQDIAMADVTQVGHYQGVWATTTPWTVNTTEFDVFDPFEVALLTLQDAKLAVNIPASNTTDDVEIIAMIAGIESAIEKATGGPVVNRQVVERCEATHGMTAMLVRKRPLVSIQSIVDVSSGASLTLTDLDIDSNSCVIRRKLRLPFLSWGPYYTVTYTAGWGTAVPPALQTAARIILQYLWESQRGGNGHPIMGGDETVQVYGMPFAIPQRAAFMMEPFVSEAYV
jgi:hypothetical protein